MFEAWKGQVRTSHVKCGQRLPGWPELRAYPVRNRLPFQLPTLDILKWDK